MNLVTTYIPEMSINVVNMTLALVGLNFILLILFLKLKSKILF